MPDDVALPEHALSETFLAGTGPGGQNVNKVASAVQLRLNVYALRLLPHVFERLKQLAGSKWTLDGEIIINAKSYRTQEANRADARTRLTEMLTKAHQAPIKRIKTKPTRSGREKRLEGKAIRSDIKKGRGRIEHE
jgi:ribosome-associated protein